MDVMPRTFEDWVSCIVNDCRINLTTTFAQQRLAVYEDPNHPETKQFAKLYGEQHLNNVVHWYRRVVDDQRFGG